MKPGGDMGNSILNGQHWQQMMTAGAKALENKKREVDALNVFPVPDGDTGTNMYLTIFSAAQDAEKTPGPLLTEVATAASMGSLMGARGNSGVILSQLLRGVAKSFDGLAKANALQVAQALQTGVDTAYKAVMKPVEGTILTVAKETAKGAMAKAKQGASILEALREGYRKGQEALARTPELLPILKQAGVVDAGGQGFLIIFEGWISALEGKTAVEEKAPALLQQVEQAKDEKAKEFIRVENLEYPYCTEFLVKGDDLRPEQIRQDLSGRGDCLMAVGTPEVVKIHIHTKNPGKILDYAIQWGALHEVQIHNMLAQNEALAHDLKQRPDQPFTPTADIMKENGVVAVTMGQGIADVFKSMGADEVVFGGQTMNPSTEDLAQAVRKVRARNVYIFPNNGNIILAARQVQEFITEQRIYVIPSRSIPQGITALLGYNPEGASKDNVQAMEGALNGVCTGEVTYAVRDSQYGELSIHSGDILGLVEERIVTTGHELFEIAQNTLEKMNWREHDLVTVFYGQETQEPEVRKLEGWLREEAPQVEVEIHFGAQPLYFYIFGVE